MSEIPLYIVPYLTPLAHKPFSRPSSTPACWPPWSLARLSVCPTDSFWEWWRTTTLTSERTSMWCSSPPRC